MSESDSRQLTRDELTTMTAEEIVAAERAGRLEALKRGEPGTPPPPPASSERADGAGGDGRWTGRPPRARPWSAERPSSDTAIASGPLRLAPAATSLLRTIRTVTANSPEPTYRR